MWSSRIQVRSSDVNFVEVLTSYFRLQAYTASCLVNFFQTGAPECIQDLLPTVFASLVKLLTDGENFVKEHALEAMSLLAGSMQTDFTPVR